MRLFLDTLGGVWQLFLLAAKTRFRLRGPYWRWRYETAFGTRLDAMPAPWQRWKAMLEYARWVSRMNKEQKDLRRQRG